MEWLFDPQTWLSLVTLTALEIILGIDNIVVISILTGKLPLEQQGRARSIGISLALIMRILFLFSIVWLAGLTAPIFAVFSRGISARDLIMFGGGLFLLVKGTHEIHCVFEFCDEVTKVSGKKLQTLNSVILQIVAMDIIFSIDSVITAVGMAQKIGIMVAAVVISLGIMLVASGAISDFIHKHQSLKMLALSFLLMIGVTLVAEGMTFHIPKGYIYFAMGFSGMVETLNIIARNRQQKQILSS